jgi:hypothetical protein
MTMLKGLAPRGLFMGPKHLVECFPEILQQVETVRDLGAAGASCRAPSA